MHQPFKMFIMIQNESNEGNVEEQNSVYNKISFHKISLF